MKTAALRAEAELRSILSEQKLPEIIEAMRQAKPEYLLVGIALLILYVACESFIIKYLMKNMGTDQAAQSE